MLLQVAPLVGAWIETRYPCFAALATNVADGTSCRHQIHDFADREALHVARVLAGVTRVALQN
jgi:hypothetical protein